MGLCLTAKTDLIFKKEIVTVQGPLFVTLFEDSKDYFIIATNSNVGKFWCVLQIFISRIFVI